ncbi:50S ribosomal protein L2 [Patescibacteria group bacterium]|nr:50S ribosomal protein L2 [Patescibacteria group bacterium]
MRHTILENKKSLGKNKPLKSLTLKVKSKAGRNSRGVITMRHQGGGVKRTYRIIDFKRDKSDIPAIVKSIEYDPYRSARIALLCYNDGEKRYIIAPVGLNVGDKVISGEKVDISVGNAMPLKNIPIGSDIYNIELQKGQGGAIARSAGGSARLQSIDGKYALVRLPSKETRYVYYENFATIGRVSNTEHSNIKLGKAGRSRYLGIRPSVRGMAMHAEEHPHGGGEGKGQVGGISKDIWGNRRGTKTRKNKSTDKYILVRRNGKRMKK